MFAIDYTCAPHEQVMVFGLGSLIVRFMRHKDWILVGYVLQGTFNYGRGCIMTLRRAHMFINVTQFFTIGVFVRQLWLVVVYVLYGL